MNKKPMDKEYLQLAAEAISARLPDNHGFILLSAPFNSAQEKDPRTVYVSNFKREDAINVLKEWLIKAGAEEDWMKHIT
jgi:hypothetical protein